MKCEIKNRFTGLVLFETEIECASDAPDSLKLGLAVKHAVKVGANLAEADLARANLADADLADANLVGANLVGANLAGAYLARANLADANLADANLVGANLVGANLADADLARAYLADANLADANLVGAYLADADLADANLVRAYLADAYLVGAKWSDSVTITKALIQISGLAYRVLIFDAHMQIGCELHTFEDWNEFDDERIAQMDGAKARRFWRDHKSTLMALCKSRATEGVE